MCTGTLRCASAFVLVLGPGSADSLRRSPTNQSGGCAAARAAAQRSGPTPFERGTRCAASSVIASPHTTPYHSAEFCRVLQSTQNRRAVPPCTLILHARAHCLTPSDATNFPRGAGDASSTLQPVRARPHHALFHATFIPHPALSLTPCLHDGDRHCRSRSWAVMATLCSRRSSRSLPMPTSSTPYQLQEARRRGCLRLVGQLPLRRFNEYRKAKQQQPPSTPADAAKTGGTSSKTIGTKSGKALAKTTRKPSRMVAEDERRRQAWQEAAALRPGDVGGAEGEGRRQARLRRPHVR
jgi:hypothetical protein